MNTKLFDQLVKQATVSGAPQIGLDDYLNEYQLICLVVKECALVATRAENNETELRPMYDVIMDHFGIADD